MLLKRHRLSLQMLTVGEWGTNCYLLGGNGQCLVVDPADEPERILGAVAGRPVVAIVLTHGHGDHLGAPRPPSGKPPAPPCTSIRPTRPPSAWLPTGSSRTDSRCGWAGSAYKLRTPPGHTPGSVCLRFDERALVGDTLFPGGPGRTDSPQALDEVVASLRSVVFTWPDETVFYPGHGQGSTIGAVRPAFQAFEGRARPADLCGDVVWVGPEQTG